MIVHINATFRDPGVSALDSRDDKPLVATLGISELQQALAAGAADPSSLGPPNADGVVVWPWRSTQVGSWCADVAFRSRGLLVYHRADQMSWRDP